MSFNDGRVVAPVSQRNTSGLHGTTSGDLTTSTNGAVLSFHNISYQVKKKSGFLLGKKLVDKEILADISGIMKPGLNAIMGPSGAGKSSFLDILAARKDSHGLSGDVLINGAPHPVNFKQISGYVAQDDFVMRVLTVRENLQFSAALRLPTTLKNNEKNEKINRVIEELGLDKVADSKILSREERKKTSIGMELVTDPSILFLDEPTTGLELTTANALLCLLRRISNQGRTIIFSINQPSYSIFKLFNSLTLLASGKLMFHGPAQEALEYFESAGYHYKPDTNPADFFLEVINGDSSSMVLNRENEDHFEANENEVLPMGENSVVEVLAKFYVKSPFYRKTKAELDQFTNNQENSSLASKEITCVNPFCHELRWITWRSFRNCLAFPGVTRIQIFITAFLGLVIGLTFLALRNDCTEIQSRAVLLFLLTVFQCITSVSAGEIFVLDEKFFLHERNSGYYRVLSYFTGKLLAEFIPRRSLPSIIITPTLYFTAGMKPSAESFFIMMFTVLILAYSASSLPLSMGVGEKVLDLGTVGVTAYFVVMLYFSGSSLYFETFVPWLSWLQYLNIPHYGFKALQHNEFLGQNFCPELNTTEYTDCQNYVICAGEEFLTIQGIDLSRWGLWMNHMALTIFMIIFLSITYLKLSFLKK